MASTAISTPESRIAEGTSIQTVNVIRRLCEGNLDPNNLRCIIENFTDRSIENCHVVPRRAITSSEYGLEFLDSLEWRWDLRKGTLNLDTRYNIFRAGASVHSMFDNGKFLIVPSEDYVTLYDEYVSGGCQRGTFAEILDGETHFNYSFVPIKMTNLPLIRQKDGVVEDLKPDDYTVFVNNFEKFPPLKSHIHPKFAIVATGITLRAMEETMHNKLIEKYSVLKTIESIFDAWVEPVPDDVDDDTYLPAFEPHNEDRDDVSGNYDPKDDDGNYSDDSNYDGPPTCTEPGRGGKKPRTRLYPDSPTPASGNPTMLGG